MRPSRPLLFCVLGLGLLTSLAPLRAEVQKEYSATKNESQVWVEQTFSTRSEASDGQQTVMYRAGFTHLGKKYSPPTRVFFGITRKLETQSNSRNSNRLRRFAGAAQMVLTVKGNRTTVPCFYDNQRDRDGDTTTITEKMVGDISLDLLKQISHAHKVAVGFLDGSGQFISEVNISEDDLRGLGELMDRIPKKDR